MSYRIEYDEHGNAVAMCGAVACVNACAGMADPATEIAELREALKFAAVELEYGLNGPSANRVEVKRMIRAALAKAEGGKG